MRLVPRALAGLTGALLAVLAASTPANGFPVDQALRAPGVSADHVPRDVAAGAGGSVFVTWFDEVQRYDSAGRLTARFHATVGSVLGPIAVDTARDVVYAADTASDRIFRFNQEGTPLGTIERRAGDIAVDGSDGSLFVLPGPVKLSPAGSEIARADLQGPSHLVVASGTHVFAYAGAPGTVWRMRTTDLGMTGSFATGHRDDRGERYEYNQGKGIAVAGDSIWVGDTYFNRFEQFGFDGSPQLRCTWPGFGPTDELASTTEGVLLLLRDGSVFQLQEPRGSQSCTGLIGRAPRLIEAFSLFPNRVVRDGRLELRYALWDTAGLTPVARFTRFVRGAKWRGRCYAKSRKLRGRPTCRRVLDVGRVRLDAPGPGGQGVTSVSRPLRGRRGLPPGRYEVQLILLDDGGSEQASALRRLYVTRAR